MSKIVFGVVPRRTKPNRTVRPPTVIGASGSVGDWTQGGITTTTPTITFPATVQANDALILHVQSSESTLATAHTGPTGWTELFSRVGPSSTIVVSGWWKKATAADVTAGSVAFGNVPGGDAGGNRGSWGCWVVKPPTGIDFAVHPPLGVVNAALTAGGATPDSPAVTVASAGLFHVFPAVFRWADSTKPPAGYSIFNHHNFSGGSGSDMVVARAVVDVVTSVDPPPWGYSNPLPGWSFESTTAVRAGASTAPVAAGNHGHKHDDLTDRGLADNHTQYSLTSGARAFTGTVSGVTPTVAAHLATKGYVDGLDHGMLAGLADDDHPQYLLATGTRAATYLNVSGLTGATAGTRYVGATASGAPTTGTFAIGDYVVARNGAIFVCTAAGTPGTWVSVGTASTALTMRQSLLLGGM